MSHVTWDEATLDKWLADPDRVIAGNDMSFRLNDAGERADIVAYLKEKGVPHVWHVDGNAHDTTEWQNNLFLFSQRLFK